jgi:hypothetical protein
VVAHPSVAGASTEGIDLDELAARLQLDWACSFSASWTALLADVAAKVERLTPVSVPATKEK